MATHDGAPAAAARPRTRAATPAGRPRPGPGPGGGRRTATGRRGQVEGVGQQLHAPGPPVAGEAASEGQEVGDDVVAERGLGRVAGVDEAVGRVELVAVLDPDDPWRRSSQQDRGRRPGRRWRPSRRRTVAAGAGCQPSGASWLPGSTTTERSARAPHAARAPVRSGWASSAGPGSSGTPASSSKQSPARHDRGRTGDRVEGLDQRGLDRHGALRRPPGEVQVARHEDPAPPGHRDLDQVGDVGPAGDRDAPSPRTGASTMPCSPPVPMRDTLLAPPCARSRAGGTARPGSRRRRGVSRSGR